MQNGDENIEARRYHVTFTKSKNAWTNADFQRLILPVYWQCPFRHRHRLHVCALLCRGVGRLLGRTSEKKGC